VLTATTTYSQVNFEALSVKEALAKADKEGKKVFVDVYTTWCGPCKWMDAEVFTNPALGERLAQSYVAIKIDKEKSPYRRELFSYYIKGYPTMLILDAKGFEIGRLFGRHSLEEVNSKLDTYDKIKGHPVTLAMAVLDQKPQEQAVWKENLKVVMDYNQQHFNSDINNYCKESCKMYYQQFDVVALESDLDFDIFRAVQPPLEHPAAQFYMQDSSGYGSYLHQDYQFEAFKRRAVATRDKAVLAALRAEVEAYYDDCFKIMNGDMSDVSWYMKDIFGAKKEIEGR
jgi:thiol-disulfide isomerase/thioredoxin